MVTVLFNVTVYEQRYLTVMTTSLGNQSSAINKAGKLIFQSDPTT